MTHALCVCVDLARSTFASAIVQYHPDKTTEPDLAVAEEKFKVTCMCPGFPLLLSLHPAFASGFCFAGPLTGERGGCRVSTPRTWCSQTPSNDEDMTSPSRPSHSPRSPRLQLKLNAFTAPACSGFCLV
eukprot:3747296-Rhodomonas_salina.2